jgi:UDP-2-acetamido-3-amino-2,3-dideoxy-glucuronate N-acetyltransferase
MPAYYAAPTCDIDPDASLGSGTKIWHLAQVREGAIVGKDCVIGRGAYIGAGVRIGNGVKIQNAAMIYEPATIDDGAFIGPGVILTNDQHPRSVTPAMKPRRAGEWEPVGVTINQGASLGAGAVCVAPVMIGAWSMVAAGAVVVDDVSAHALVAGVPAKQIAWVGKDGRRLQRHGTDEWRSIDGVESYAEDHRGLLDHAEAAQD